MKEITAVIFDMDGVLIDSQPLHYMADVESMKKYGVYKEQEFYEKYAGTTTPDRMRALNELFKLNADVDEMVAVREQMILDIMKKEEISPVRGITELLKSIKSKGMTTAVASSSGYELINMVLEKLGIAQYFDCITSGIDVKHGKPAPDVFLLAAERINKSPEECVVVEDSENGVNAAVAAGMKSVGYINPTSGKQCLDKANIVIDDFRKIDADVIYKL